jgi:electron transport complex protein RnfB
MAYQIDKFDCVGCCACIFACPFDVPTEIKEEHKVIIPEDKCVGCGQCEDICPVAAIHPAPGQRKIRKVTILEETCIGCTACARGCPAGAINGTVKNPHSIDQRKCIQCGFCGTKCKKDAIVIEYLA